MGDAKPTVVVTGISGNLGTRLLPQLGAFNVIGLDVNPPVTDLPQQFERMDLGEEQSCRQLFLLLRESRAEAVIHLAFILDTVRAGVLDLDRMWHINVAGTARVMEAITEANHEETIVRKFVFPSSVSVYGSDLTGPATEEHPLGAHTLPKRCIRWNATKWYSSERRRCEGAARICCVRTFLPGRAWITTWSALFGALPAGAATGLPA